MAKYQELVNNLKVAYDVADNANKCITQIKEDIDNFNKTLKSIKFVKCIRLGVFVQVDKGRTVGDSTIAFDFHIMHEGVNKANLVGDYTVSPIGSFCCLHTLNNGVDCDLLIKALPLVKEFVEQCHKEFM